MVLGRAKKALRAIPGIGKDSKEPQQQTTRGKGMIVKKGTKEKEWGVKNQRIQNRKQGKK